MRTLSVCLLALFAFVSAPAQQKPAPRPAQLPYPMRQPLKDATYYLDEAEGLAEAITQGLAKLKGREDDPSVPLNTVQTLKNTVEKARKSLGLADARFKQLPADHPDVAEQLKRVEPINATLTTLDTQVSARLGTLTKIVDPNSYADLKDDLARLKEINQMFARPDVLTQRPEEAVALAGQIASVKTERERLLKKYAALMQQETAEGKDFQGVMRHFDTQFGAFDTAAREFVKQSPEEIQTQVNEVLAMGRSAVAEKKPAFFGEHGGVPQQLARVQDRFVVFAALDPNSPAVAAAKKLLDDARAQTVKMAASLSEGILDANRLPAEVYKGADAGELTGLLKAKWAKDGAKGDVLRVGINSHDWTRTSRWEWNANAWRKVDYSLLQGFVAVKSAADLAVVYHINIVKDHLQGDRLELHLFDDLKEEPAIQRKIRLKNLK